MTVTYVWIFSALSSSYSGDEREFRFVSRDTGFDGRRSINEREMPREREICETARVREHETGSLQGCETKRLG